LPGLILGLLFWLTVREPPRGFADDAQVSGPPATLLSTVRHFIRLPSLHHIPIAQLLYGISAWGGSTWTATYFVRVHHMDIATVGTWLTVIIMLAGVTGTLLGGFGADRIVKKTGDVRWYMWISAAGILAAIPFSFFIFTTPHPIAALLGMFVPFVFLHLFLGPSGATLVALSGVKRRAMVVALNFGLSNLVSVTLGPLIIGMVSDAYKTEYGDVSLRYAILTLTVTANLWAALHYLLAARTLREDFAHANDE
jgi:hypothetical protein